MAGSRVALLLPAALAAVLFTAASAATADVLVGVAGPLAGQLAWIGQNTQTAALVAADDLNAAGGVLGQRVRLVQVDDNCDGTQARAAARKLVGDGVAFMLGHMCSGAALAASPVYEEAKVPLISNGATNPVLTERGLRYTFRVVGRDDQQGALAGDYLAERSAGKAVAIVHDGQPYGQGLAEVVRERLHRRGARETLFAAVEPGRSDFGPLLAEVGSRAIDVLYYGGYTPDAALLVRQARARGLAFQLVGGDGLSGQDFPTIAGDAGEGVRLTLYPDARALPEAAPVVAELRARGEEPELPTLHGYAGMQAWAQAVQRAGTFDGEAVARALRGHTFGTIIGRLGFDAKGDVVGAETFVWYVWRGGTYVPVDDEPADVGTGAGPRALRPRASRKPRPWVTRRRSARSEDRP